MIKQLLIDIFLSVFISVISYSATYQAVILKISGGDKVLVKRHGNRKIRVVF